MTPRIEIDDRWYVDASIDVPLEMAASTAWGQMRDFQTFITIDPLHRRVRLVDRERLLISPAASAIESSPRGAQIVIEHRFCGIGPDRVGRIVHWREGRGFAFSDLSRRGERVGFPHVCGYELSAIDASRCTLTISARGRWTARWLPRFVAKYWLAWVLCETAGRVQHAMRRLSMIRVASAARVPSAAIDRSP